MERETPKPITFGLNKLVRDGIVTDTEESGDTVKWHRLEGVAKQKALINKLIEEANEMKAEKVDAEALADIKEALDQLIKDAGITEAELAAAQQAKRDRIGGLENGDFVDTMTFMPDNQWAKYYGADPERFPVVEE